jgi:hypothetical protein
MPTVTAQPSIKDLNKFISMVNSFPLTAGQLPKLAKQKGASPKVIEFYKRFAPDTTFDNKEDLAACSEQVELMREEEAKMPQEEEKATEEF